MITINELENYKDYGRCLHLSNGVIETVVSLDVGPRILRYGFIGGKNLMNTDRKALGFKTDKEYCDFFGENKKWEIFGGHRIWTSPEAYPETYIPDDMPVGVKFAKNGAIFSAECKAVGLAYALELTLDDDDANMQVKMTVRNTADADKRFAVWGLSVCAAEGTMVIPMNTNDTGLLHNRNISVWPYTDMSDPRIYWGKKYVTVKQDRTAATPIKLGFDLGGGTAYYRLGNDVLRKRFDTFHPEASYPDGGCSFETYTNNVMLEFETLSPLETVAPGGEISLSENWSLFKTAFKEALDNDNAVEQMLASLE